MTVDHSFVSKMAVRMALFWSFVVFSVIGADASGEFTVLHSPRSLKFSGSSKTLESLLKEIFCASLGLSVEENSEWNGLSIVDPFNTPEAVVEVYIDGVNSLGNTGYLKGKVYPLSVDEYEPNTFEAVEHRIKQHFTTGGNKLVKLDMSDIDQILSRADVFGAISPPKATKLSLQHLKYSVEEDFQFLTELDTLKTIANQVKVIKPDNVIDFYNFRFRSLHALSDFHGPNSMQTKEAKRLLCQALLELSNAFVKAYDGSVLVTAVVTDVAHTRRTIRSPDSGDEAGEKQDQQAEANHKEEDKEEGKGEGKEEGKGEAKEEGKEEGKGQHKDDKYSAEYSAIFNIILWFGVVFSFTLIAIVYAIMDMDPGRDSIIYRMTSTRMKKDN